MLSFKAAFSLSSFTFIKRLFSSSLLSALRVVSSVYLRLLIFLQEDLKSINSYNMREGRMISVFSVPAFQDSPWFYLLFGPWVTTFWICTEKGNRMVVLFLIFLGTSMCFP